MIELEILTSEAFSSLNAYRKFANAIVNLLTPLQLKTLKSRLTFDPRKLPLNREALMAVFPIEVAENAPLHTLQQKYFKLFDEFAKLIEPQQLAALHGYAEYVAQKIAACEEDYALDSLELLHGELLNFLETAKTH